MPKIFSVLVLILLLFYLPFKTLANGYTDVTVSEANSMIGSNPSLVILDVRTQSEYDSGHIREAKLIPVTELEGRLDELNKNNEILVYCRLGGRSSTASQILADNGFLYIYNMLGGITNWINEGYPVYIKYSSIQEAVNNADLHDTLYISSGIYHEYLIMNKSLSLIGEDTDNTVIDGNYTGNVVEVTANDVLINGFTIQHSNQSSSYAAIRIAGSAWCNITGNNITRNKIAILVISHDSRIEENSVTHNGQGIALYGCSDVTVKANTMSANTVGISLVISSSNTIIENKAENSSFGGCGLTITSNSFNNTIQNNNLIGNFHGMLLSRSYNNSIISNIIANNELLGIELAASSNNTFFHNNVINNPTPVNVDTHSSNHSICVWDNGCEGNFWSDYNDTDSNGDGIGDTKYIIDQNNTDRYPLMNVYWNPADVNHDLEVDIYDIVLACGAYGSTISDPNWNCHCDITEPYGVVDIYDIVVMCNEYGKEYDFS